MDNTIYISLSRQIGLFQDLEMLANNIANVNTPGYNAQKMLFSQYLVKDAKHQDAYANNPSSYRDTTGGGIKTTGNPFDLAISGSGYFQVQTPLGIRFTRAGNFQINADGTLVNPNGYPVLGSDNAQITIPANARNVQINGIGQVSVDGQDVGQVGVVTFANEQAMTRLGNNLYNSTTAPIPADQARVTQGAIETSNVSPVVEMVHVMNVSRSVSNTAKLNEVIYDLERKTSDTYTRASQTA